MQLKQSHNEESTTPYTTLRFSPGTVLLQNGLQHAHELLRVHSLLATQRVHLLVEVCDLHPGLREVRQLLGQMRQEVLQVGRRASGCVAAHGDHLLQFVLQRRIDGSDGILTAEE